MKVAYAVYCADCGCPRDRPRDACPECGAMECETVPGERFRAWLARDEARWTQQEFEWEETI